MIVSEEEIFQSYPMFGNLKIMFSDYVSEDKILHNEEDGVIYISEKRRYRLYFSALGLEKGFEMCQKHALNKVDLVIKQSEIRDLFTGNSPIFFNTENRELEHNVFSFCGEFKEIKL